MSDERTTLTVEHTLAFGTLGAERVAVHVDHVVVAEDVTAAVQVTWEAWERCLAGSLFHLDGVDAPPGFEPGEPVSLRLRLRPGLAAGLPGEDEALVLALFEDGSACRHTEAWLATEATQTLPVPGEDDLTVDVGVRTGWAAPIGGPPSAVAVVTGYLTAEGWPHDLADEDLVRFDADLDAERKWRVLVHVDEEARLLRVYSVHPRLVPVESRAAAALWLGERNYDLGVGAFELDPEDGEVRFRTSAPATREAFGATLRENLSIMAAHFAGVAEL